MERFFRIVSSPGTKGMIKGTAPTQGTDKFQVMEPDKTVSVQIEIDPTENVDGYTGKVKAKLLDRWLDRVVQFSGSEFIFLLIIGALVAWAFMGIVFGHSITWQVVISDAQAVLTYIFDSLLMRQQLNGYDSHLTVSACLKSRNISNKRMLRKIVATGMWERVNPIEVEELKQTGFATELPTENWLDRLSTRASHVLGHIITVSLFWVCILIWIGFGHYCGWTYIWQLYINSSTSALMVLVFAFLANIRERHSKFTENCLDSIYRVDAVLEINLRAITGDDLPNEPVGIPGPKVTKIQRVIDYYADLVGTLVGIAILIMVLAVWLAIGPVMAFDSNWWLIIGTYAGLIGMNDGFVLRNVDNRLRIYEDEQFEQVRLDDMDVFAAIGTAQLPEEKPKDVSLSCRISMVMGTITSHEAVVVLGAATVIGLVIGSSAMGWSITGQLLSNIPPSIIESFFMIILITGHNVADSRRRVDLHNFYLRRLKLVSYVNQLR